MNEQEILDYNKMCAKYLNLHRDKEVVIHNMASYCYAQLKFHSDWNLIMEVVEAIEKKQAWVNIKGCSADISILANTSAPSKKEAVVEAINQFLTLYFWSKDLIRNYQNK